MSEDWLCGPISGYTARADIRRDGGLIAGYTAKAAALVHRTHLDIGETRNGYCGGFYYSAFLFGLCYTARGQAVNSVVGRHRTVGAQLSNKRSEPAILFVCLGNTCRSVVAETLARREFGDTVTILSAGLCPQPAEDAERAIAMLKNKYGLDATRHVPKNIRNLAIEDFDYVVAMDKSVASKLGHVPKEKLITWRVKDP